MNPPLLEAQDLVVRYRQHGPGVLPWRTRRAVGALDSVSLTVEAGESIGIVGPSGSGKSTLARCLVRLTRPDRGAVSWRGQDTAVLAGAAARAFHRQVQLVPQSWATALDPRWTIADSLAEPALAHRVIDRRDRDRYVDGLLELVGLPRAYRLRRPGELSGGQAQRAVIARAVGLRPDVLVADEAVSALDVSTRAHIVKLLEDLRGSHRLALVFISHDLATVAHLTERVLVLHEGAVVDRGTIEDLLRHPHHPVTAELAECADLTGPAGSEIP